MTDELVERLAAALAELEELRAENARLRGLLRLDDRPVAAAPLARDAAPGEPRCAGRRSELTPGGEAGLYRSVLAGRDDVYALRWETVKAGKARWSPAVLGGWSRTGQGPRTYPPGEVAARLGWAVVPVVGFDHGADLVRDVISHRVGAVSGARGPGYRDRDERRDMVGLSGHAETGDEVDVEVGELRSPR